MCSPPYNIIADCSSIYILAKFLSITVSTVTYLTSYSVC